VASELESLDQPPEGQPGGPEQRRTEYVGAHPYRLDEPGGFVLVKESRDKNGKVTSTQETKLTNFGARITADVAVDDGTEVRREFEISASVNGHSARFTVPAERFAGMSWVTEHLGASAIVRAGMGLKDHARAAIQYLSGDQIPQRRIYAHTGWRELPGGWGYLTASGAMMASGLDKSVTVDIGPLSGYELPEPVAGPALIAAIRASLAILVAAPDRVTVPLLGAVYRAPLPLPPDCTPWLYGRTGTFKTALCALAQQHFGAGLDSYSLPGNWTSTANMLELQAFTLDGALFVVDDYSPDHSTLDARKRAGVADRLLRGAANHGARGRLRADATMRPPRPARAQILTSAEDLPPAGVSLRARTMVCEVAQGAVHPKRLTAAQQAADSGQLTAAMSGYVQHLAARFPDLPAELRGTLREYRDAARAGGHPRTALNVASLALGWQQWLSYAVAADAVSDAEGTGLCRRVWKVLCDLGAEQARYQRDADPVSAYLRALAALIAAGRAHLASPIGSCPAEPQRWGWRWREHGEAGSFYPQGELIGWVEDGTDVYLHPDAAYRAAREFTERSGAPLGVSKNALHDDLAERGLLATASGAGHHTIRRDLGGQRSRRVLHLSAYTFEHGAEA
jgi:hypothetical protein